MTTGGKGRRFLITVGVSKYRQRAIKDLPGVPRDVQRVRELLGPMGYEVVLADLGVDPSARDVTVGIDRWVAGADLCAEDVVIVYFAGHGIKTMDRHYLLCGDSEPGLSSTALASEDLSRPLMYSAVGHLLVVLDTCYAAEGAGDIAQVAKELARFQRETAGRWMLAAAGGKQKAEENAFVDALAEILARPQAGAHQEFLGVREVTERVNKYFKAHHPGQRARHSTIDSDGYAPFFRNTAYIPDLPANDLDVETLNQLRQRTRGHFDARGRGMDHVGERGDYFTGRTNALAAVTGWLDSMSHDRKARVITGSPGSGKSALLGRVLRLSGGRAVVPLHASRAALEGLVRELATALNLPAGTDRDGLLEALSRRLDPVVIVIDALDEAGTAVDVHEGPEVETEALEGRRIARELLQPLSSMPAVRLLIGTRRPQIKSIGTAVQVIDLDAPAYVKAEDVEGYAFKLLIDGQDPESLSPYRDRPEEAAVVAQGIAARASTSFLVARMTARALVMGQIVVDTTCQGWEEALPQHAEDAFAAYLDRFGRERAKVERLLRPLAYAQGTGLPWSTLWAPLAEALSGLPCPQDELNWLQDQAGAYVVETAAAEGGSVYRLFHETMAEYLRRQHRDPNAHHIIATTLTALVPDEPQTGRRDWQAAHRYIRDHVAAHAAAGGLLDGLSKDTDFLVHASPTSLAPALHGATSRHGRAVRAVYQASIGIHTHAAAPERRHILAVDAARYNQTSLAQELTDGLPWRPKWATGTSVHPALLGTLTGPFGWIYALALADLGHRPHAITVGADSMVRVWDIATLTQRDALTGHLGPVQSVACTPIEGRLHAVTASDDATVVVWDLTTSRRRATLVGHEGPVWAVACTRVKGRPHAVTTGEDATVRLWDLTTGTQQSVLFRQQGVVRTLACTAIDDQPHVLTGGKDATVQVWNLISGSRHRVLTGHKGSVRTLSCTAIDGRPHAVTGGDDQTVRLWDLTDGSMRLSLDGHHAAVRSSSCLTIGGRPHVITGANDAVARVWDLTSGNGRILASHSDPVLSTASAVIDGRPHALTAGGGTSARLWDLGHNDQHTGLAGHSDIVESVACAPVRGRPQLVTGGRDTTARVWDIAAQGLPLRVTRHDDWVRAVACTSSKKKAYAIVAGDSVEVWDLTKGIVLERFRRHTDWVRSVAGIHVDDRLIVVSGGDDAVRVWPVDEWGKDKSAIQPRVLPAMGSVRAVACTTIHKRPHALVSDSNGTIRVWDLSTGGRYADLSGHSGHVEAMSTTTIGGRPHAITAGTDSSLRVWDLIACHERAVLTGHQGTVRALAPLDLGSRPHAVSTGEDRTVRVWDLTTSDLVQTAWLPLPGNALATSDADIVVGMGNEIIVFERQSPVGSSPVGAQRREPGQRHRGLWRILTGSLRRS
ncbi:caspase family protein [Streptomyces sp. NPDC005498]|uniref:caspase family protein n=1 Tax=Streptomyces sp. NPDC005498 TaxID=3364717 RepID=UPI003687C8D1